MLKISLKKLVVASAMVLALSCAACSSDIDKAKQTRIDSTTAGQLFSGYKFFKKVEWNSKLDNQGRHLVGAVAQYDLSDPDVIDYRDKASKGSYLLYPLRPDVNALQATLVFVFVGNEEGEFDLAETHVFVVNEDGERIERMNIPEIIMKDICSNIPLEGV